MAFSSPVLIDIWSDDVCPFCYLELPAVIKLRQNFDDAPGNAPVLRGPVSYSMLHATVADLVA